MHLVHIAEIVANNGLMVPPREDAQVKEREPRKDGIRLGVKIIFFSLVMLPIFVGISIMTDAPEPLVFPLAVFLAGLSWLLYSAIFKNDRVVENTPPRIAQLKPILPLGERVAVNAVPLSKVESRQVITSELGPPPPSVTEHTTKFFDKEDQ